MRFTRIAQRILVATRHEAELFQHKHIGTGHLLMAMLQEEAPVSNVLRVSGLQLRKVQDVVQRLYREAQYPPIPEPELALELKIVLSQAASEAHAMHRNYIGSDVLFLTLLSQPTCHAVKILTELNIRPASLRQEFQIARSGGPPARLGDYFSRERVHRSTLPTALPDKASVNAKYALTIAREAAEQYGHPVLNSAHLLVGLIEAEGQAQRVLTYLGLDSTQLREALQAQYTSDRVWDGRSVHMSGDLQEALLLAQYEARPGENAIGTGHLLLGITLQPKSAALDILKQFNVSASRIQGQIIRKLVAE